MNIYALSDKSVTPPTGLGTQKLRGRIERWFRLAGIGVKLRGQIQGVKVDGQK